MILSDTTIREREIVSPFFERTKHASGMSFGLSMCGYDVRSNAGIRLTPNQGALLDVIEFFSMPDDVVGLLKDKSTWLRIGLRITQGVLEPGWRGHPTIWVQNHSTVETTIRVGDPIAQVLFMKTDQPVGKPYDGKYQDQGAAPVAARYEMDYATGKVVNFPPSAA